MFGLLRRFLRSIQRFFGRFRFRSYGLSPFYIHLEGILFGLCTERQWRHSPPKVYGRERFDLPHQQKYYILRPRKSICRNSPRLISPAQRPIEDTTHLLFGYLALNEQPLLARLRPAGGTERIVVIAESTKQFVLCKSFRPDFTLTFRSHILVLFGVEIGSRNCRQLSRSIEDFGLHDKIALSDSNARFRPKSHYCLNQKLGSQKFFEKLKPQPEEPKNVTQFLSRTTEIHKYVKINTVDLISFLVRIVR